MSTMALENIPWAAGFVGHVALLAVLFGRSCWGRFPIFTSLIAYQIIVSAALFGISRYGSHHAYFLAYWIFALGDYCFQIALTFEIARSVFRSTGTWGRMARREILLWSAVGTLLAAGLCLTLSPPTITGLDLWEMRATLFTSLLTCEVFVSVSTAANRRGLRWQSHAMTLGEGLAAWAFIAVLGDVAHFATGWRKELSIFDQTRMYVYLGVLLMWIISFWHPEQAQMQPSSELNKYVSTMHQRVRRDLTIFGKME